MVMEMVKGTRIGLRRGGSRSQMPREDQVKEQNSGNGNKNLYREERKEESGVLKLKGDGKRKR